MPLKKDASGKRWVEMALRVPGTPEQVWAAVATGGGNAGWFLPAEIEPRVGGALRFDFGEGVSSHGEVTEWAPPQRFGYVERDWSEGAPPVFTEIEISTRSGDQCVLRMAHALFTEADTWDAEVEHFESGWPAFFVLLKLYLKHFAGQPAASFMASSATPAADLPTWLDLGQRLDLSGVSVGERRVSGGGPEAWAGEVVHSIQDQQHRFVVVHLDTPAPGILAAGTWRKPDGGTRVSVCRYLYGEDAARGPEVESAWRAWLKATWSAPKG